MVKNNYGPKPNEYEYRLYRCPVESKTWQGVYLRSAPAEECRVCSRHRYHPGVLMERRTVKEFFRPGQTTEVSLHRASVLNQVRSLLKKVHLGHSGEAVYALIAAYMQIALGSAPTVTMYQRFAAAVSRGWEQRERPWPLNNVLYGGWMRGGHRVRLHGTRIVPDVLRAGDGYIFYEGQYWLALPGKPIDRRAAKKPKRAKARKAVRR